MPIRQGVYVADVPATGEPSQPPVVLIHGAYGSHLDWPASLRRMRDARVVALDLPGHGKSPGSGHDTVAAYTTDLIGLLDALHIERAILVGHSMGGAIALTLAIEYPARAAGLILVGTAARLRVAPAILDGLTVDLSAIARQIAAWTWSEQAPDAARQGTIHKILGVDPRITLGDFVACSHFDEQGRVGQIAAPTLVVCGAEDRMVPASHSQALAERIPGAALITLPGAGHMVMFEQSAAFDEAVGSWLHKHAWQAR